MAERLCSAIAHSYHPDANGEWTETYYDSYTGAVLFMQPIPPGRPSQTPPATVGLENAWCIADEPPKPVLVAETQTAETVAPVEVRTARTHEPGMGAFFLLVLAVTGGIAAFQHYQQKYSAEGAHDPQFLPHPWHNIPDKTLERYGDYIEQCYPPMPHERIDGAKTGTLTGEHAGAATGVMVPISPESRTTKGSTEIQPGIQPEIQPSLNLSSTSSQMQFNQDSTGISTEGVNVPNFDPRQEEQPGEFETFMMLVKVNAWSPTGKDILKALWRAQPRGSRYEPAVERRNIFANRLKEYAFNG